MKVPAQSVSGEDSLPVLQMASSPLCTHLASSSRVLEKKRESKVCGMFCYKDSKPTVGGSTLMTSSNPPKRPHLQIPFHWASTYGFGRDTNIQSITPNLMLKLGLKYITPRRKIIQDTRVILESLSACSIKEGTSWVKSRMLFSFQSKDGISGFLALGWGSNKHFAGQELMSLFLPPILLVSHCLSVNDTAVMTHTNIF